MPEIPHEYTVRGLTAPPDEAFDWFVRYIRRHGYERRWGARTFTYLNVGGWRYWTMGARIAETTVVNRARLEAADGPVRGR